MRHMGISLFPNQWKTTFFTLPPPLDSSFTVDSGQNIACKQIFVPQPMEQNYYVTHTPPLNKTYNVGPVQQNVKQKEDNVLAYPHVYNPILPSSSPLICTTHPNQNTFHSSFNTSYLVEMRVSQLPFFSAEEQKGDVSFEVWKFELNYLIKESVYPDSLILQAIIKSLRGKSRDILLILGESASSSIILNKLEGIYSNLSSNEVLLQNFYLVSQLENESIADYSVRIENLLRRATQNRPVDEVVRSEMLCARLWNVLRDPLLKLPVVSNLNLRRILISFGST